MKDVAAVAPLLLVAGVFVGVCIAALRATDWSFRVDRRPPGAHAAAPGLRDEHAAAAEQSTASAGTSTAPVDVADERTAPATADPAEAPPTSSAEPDLPAGPGRHRGTPGNPGNPAES